MQVPNPTKVPYKFKAVAMTAKHMPLVTRFPSSFLLMQNALCEHLVVPLPREMAKVGIAIAEATCLLSLHTGKVVSTVPGSLPQGKRKEPLLEACLAHKYITANSPILVFRAWHSDLPAAFKATQELSRIWWRWWE